MPNSNVQGSELTGLEVMVVDDEVDIRELLAAYLHAQGLIVTTMPDGQAAVDALDRSNGRFSLVVTDINMPGADGFDVVRAARRANAAADVVVITGYASDGGAQKALGLGAHDYLHKPFKLRQLDTILVGITERHALESARPER